MGKVVYKKDAVVRDDLSSWFICRKMEGGELLLTLKSEIKERDDFQDICLESPVFDHGFTAFRIMKRYNDLEWITFINETRRDQSKTFHYGCHITYRNEWESENIKIILSIADELIRYGEPESSPIRNLALDKPITAPSQTEDYILSKMVKRAGKKIHDAGGCDAEDDYSRGYDDAVTLALDILLEETGYVMEDFLDYEENRETENP